MDNKVRLIEFIGETYNGTQFRVSINPVHVMSIEAYGFEPDAERCTIFLHGNHSVVVKATYSEVKERCLS